MKSINSPQTLHNIGAKTSEKNTTNYSTTLHVDIYPSSAKPQEKLMELEDILLQKSLLRSYEDVNLTTNSLLTSNQNSNNINKVLEDNSINTKKFDITISKKEMDKFKSAIQNGTEDTFITEYINEHNQSDILTKSDVYSLVLNCAAIFEDKELIKYILENANEKDNILTSIDSEGSSPIANLLHSNNEEILLSVNDYICRVYDKIEKTQLTGEDIANIIFVVNHPPCLREMTSIDCFYDFIAPLYSEQSLQNLAIDIGLIGANNEV